MLKLLVLFCLILVAAIQAEQGYRKYYEKKHWSHAVAKETGGTPISFGRGRANDDPETEGTTEDAPETEGTTEPAPETEATTEPAPETEATTEPAPETEATTEPAPETEPTTEPAPETETTTEPAPETEPTTEPAPETEATTEPAPETEATSEPAPETEPTTEPAPETEPTTEPAPETEPTTEPAPETEPTTEPAPETEPTTEPAPETEPTTETAPETEPTTEPGSTTVEPTTPPTSDCTAPYSCLDCNTARICRPSGQNGIFEVLSTIKCPRERPYCNPDSGSCSEVQPDSCGDHDNTFVCMGNGRFPDIDCTKFHACVEYESVTFQCPEGSNYNPSTKVCDPSYKCGTFTCDETVEVKKVAHSLDEKYFAYCNSDHNGPVVIDSCPGPYKLNPDSQLCEPLCTENGLIPNMYDCTKYHKCTFTVLSKAMSYYKMTDESCPTGQAFSQKDFICKDEKYVDCSKSKD